MMSRFSLMLPFLVFVLSLVSCSDGSTRRLYDAGNGTSPGGQAGNTQVDQAADLQRLEPMTGLLKKMGLLPDRYSVTMHQTSGKKKNEIFEEWYQKKLSQVDQPMRDLMMEWKVLDQKDSWQEYVGTFRSNRKNDDTSREIADMFLYAADLSPDERHQIQMDVQRLKEAGIEFGFNGFDSKGCSVSPEDRQMDDYAESPIFIDPSTGRLYEFKYTGGCRD